MSYIPPVTGPPISGLALKPSDVVAPTKVDEAPQQRTILILMRDCSLLSLMIIASTAPGDGHTVHDNLHEKEETRSQSAKQGSDPGKVPFKEQVIGLFFLSTLHI
jgi:hypothetical protein